MTADQAIELVRVLCVVSQMKRAGFSYGSKMAGTNAEMREMFAWMSWYNPKSPPGYFTAGEVCGILQIVRDEFKDLMRSGRLRVEIRHVCKRNINFVREIDLVSYLIGQIPASAGDGPLQELFGPRAPSPNLLNSLGKTLQDAPVSLPESEANSPGDDTPAPAHAIDDKSPSQYAVQHPPIRTDF